MTVTYHASTVTTFGDLIRLISLWRGSVFKISWPILLLYVMIHYLIRMFHYLILLDKDPPDRDAEKYISIFNQTVENARKFQKASTLHFVLGFYVTWVLGRWWATFMAFAWPDNCCLAITAFLQGMDERGRMMRRTVARYIILAYVMVLMQVCPKTKMRFPNYNYLVSCGLLLPHEKINLDFLSQSSFHRHFWVPIVWSGNLAVRANHEGRMDQYSLAQVIKTLMDYRKSLQDMLNYAWIPSPYMYTQAATLYTYAYICAGIMADQVLPGEFEMYVPVLRWLEIIFYLGWLKVAEMLLIPYGFGDESFETNWLIDRNFQVSFLMADHFHINHPKLYRDAYWNVKCPEPPYTKGSMKFKTTKPFVGTAMRRENKLMSSIEDKIEQVKIEPELIWANLKLARLKLKRKPKTEIPMDKKMLEIHAKVKAEIQANTSERYLSGKERNKVLKKRDRKSYATVQAALVDQQKNLPPIVRAYFFPKKVPTPEDLRTVADRGVEDPYYHPVLGTEEDYLQKVAEYQYLTEVRWLAPDYEEIDRTEKEDNHCRRCSIQ